MKLLRSHRCLGVVTASHLVTDLNLGSLPAVLPFFVSLYGFDYRDVAGLMFASCFLSSLVQPLFGWLADRGQRHWFMVRGILLCGVSFAVPGVLTGYWAIFTAVMLSGIGSAIFHPEAARLVNALSGGHRGTAMSVFSVGGNAGFGIGPMAAVALITFVGMKGLVVYGVLAAGFALFLLTRLGWIDECLRSLQTESGDGVRAAKTPGSRPAGENDWRSFARLTAYIFGRSVIHTGFGNFLPLFCIYALGATEAEGGLTVSVIAVAGIFCTMIGGPMADRFGYVRMLRWGSLLLVPVLALAVFPRSMAMVWLMLIPYSLAMNCTYTPFVVLGQSYLARSVGFASGVTLGLSFSVGGILAPALGWLGDACGIDTVMAVLFVLSIGCLALAFWMPEPRPRRDTPSGPADRSGDES